MTNKGFTILEVLITIVILTVGVVALMGGLSTGILSSSESESTMVGINLAQRRIEEFKNLDFETEIIAEAKADVTDFTGFQREVAVSEPLDDLKQVTVTVYWQFKADEISTQLVTNISKN